MCCLRGRANFSPTDGQEGMSHCAYKSHEQLTHNSQVTYKRQSSNTNQLSNLCQCVAGPVHHKGKGAKPAKYQGWSDPGGKEPASQNHY